MHLDIDERHLLRLGHGEEMLETEKDFSRYGRVNYVLQQRLALLKEVNRLQKSLGVQGEISFRVKIISGEIFVFYHVISFKIISFQNDKVYSGDVSYTCETAGHFYLYQVLSRWEKFLDDVSEHRKTKEGIVYFVYQLLSPFLGTIGR